MPYVMRRGDWLCRDGTCSNLNMAWRENCNMCKVVRPDLEVVALRLKVEDKQEEIDVLKAKAQSLSQAMASTQQSPAWASQAAPNEVAQVGPQSVVIAEAARPAPTSKDELLAAMLTALNAALVR